MATTSVSKGGTLPDSAGKSDFYNLIDNATVSISNIVNADIDSSAGIVDTKLAQITTADKVHGSSLTGTLTEDQGSDTASATTTDIGAVDGNYIHITGTTTITGLGTVQAGIRKILVFDGVLTLTHNATSLILPTGANITTAAGDVAIMISEGSGNWRCASYTRADGTALAAATVSNIYDGALLQVVRDEEDSLVEATSTIPKDDTKPEDDEGTEVLSQAITPNATTNILLVEVVCNVCLDSTGNAMVCLHNSDIDADYAVAVASSNVDQARPQAVSLTYKCLASDCNGTSATTFTVRIGGDNAGDLNGASGSRYFGGSLISSLTIKEIKAS